jgi:hypothetical protein
MHREPEVEVPDRRSRERILERKLRHDGALQQIPLGCAGCAERQICGGLAVEAELWNCLSLCCGQRNHCDRVCRNNPNFARHVHEIGGFALTSLPPTPSLTAPTLPMVIPEVFHGVARRRPFAPAVASVSLYRMFDRRTGEPRYCGHTDICNHFKISEGTPLLLTGIQRDRPLERWWELGKSRRKAIIRAAQDCGVVLVTTPNYSLFLDRPRWDDLHAIKRIAWTYLEFLEAGMPAALHVNGRTETDFRRWTEFIIEHPEVTHVAYEFTTGPGRPTRRRQHAAWLCGLAAAVGRPLHLLVRGGTAVLPELCTAFAGVTFLETTAFLKTMMRFRAIKGDPLSWWLAPTAVGEPLDDLFATNWESSRDYIAAVIRHHSRREAPEVAIA